MLAVVPVRAGTLPAGGAEAVAECAGRGLLAGEGTHQAATSLHGVARELHLVELGVFAPARFAAALAPMVAEEAHLVLPASPDGRDLAPRLASVLNRQLLAGAIEVRARTVALARWGGLAIEDVAVDRPFVATLQPGVRGVDPDPLLAPPMVTVRVAASDDAAAPDIESLEVLAPDIATMDLAEAPRIAGGGAGLDGPERFEQLAAVATAIGAATGATRVVTDRHWVGHERQIGTTGVVVDPRLYLAFGISGAVQHTSGLGSPDHIVSVNTDAHCPMMQLADLAIVADANAVIAALADRLSAEPPRRTS
jgi:electron transfer flavoprotein alpha subunit